jgi:CDP-glycerol glycerophosphotransferase
MVWLVSDVSLECPAAIRKVKLQSLKASYELSTAKVIVSNVRATLPYKKKLTQYYIQTWHGSVAFKAIEKDAVDKLRPDYVREAVADSRMISLFLSSNSIQTHEIQTCFWYDGEIFESGSPRNDMLFMGDNVKNRIKQRLGLVPDTKVVLYAPTFRDDFRTDVYNLNLPEVCSRLTSSLGGRWTALARLHPNVMEAGIMVYGDTVLNASSYPDMQELLLIADVLITDYSSTIYDAAIMHKLVLLYAPDLDDYKANRGLKQVYFDFPARVCQTQDELFSFVDELDMAAYHARLRAFLGKIRIFDDGHASQRVADRILSVMNVAD